MINHISFHHVSTADECLRHGRQYLEFKCRYCCSIAVWFCFGTTHFCETCHNNNGVLTPLKPDELVPCPCLSTPSSSLTSSASSSEKKKGMPEALSAGSACPLGVAHPPHGEEFALGCALCRESETM
jgi:E3 ubiquitin-protein ligase MYCBP2